MFAEFIEHREAFMILRKWWRPGYKITLTYILENERNGSETCEVEIRKIKALTTSWASVGRGVTIDEAAKKAAAQAAFRD